MLGVQARVMHILVVGLDYKSAPVDIREKLTFQPDELGQAMSQLKEEKAYLRTSSCRHATGQSCMQSLISCTPDVII